MHIKRIHRVYSIHHNKPVSLKAFAKFAARFGDKEGEEARRWLAAKGIKVET